MIIIERYSAYQLDDLLVPDLKMIEACIQRRPLAVLPAQLFIRCLLLVAALTAAIVSPSAQAEGPVTLNLKEADITSLIATVAEATNKNFIIDPRVRGKVTVISHQDMQAEELYQVFLSILQVHGFAAVPSGDVIKILPDTTAKQLSTPFATHRQPGAGDEIVTRVLQVKNTSAAQLVPLLRPLVPQQGHLAAYAPTNVLIVSDRANNISRLVTVIERIDKVSDNELEIITLQYASASEIVRIITNLSKRPAAKGAAIRATPTVVADERTNSVILGGEPINRLRLRTLIAHLDTPLESTGNTRVIYLKYAKASELKDVLTNVSQTLEEEEKKTKGAKVVSKGKQVSIQADEATNALVITAPPDIMASLQLVISKLDIRRAQVLVEAVIAKVNRKDVDDLGVEWRTNPVTDSATGSLLSLGLPAGIDGVATLSGLTAPTATTSPSTGFSFGLFSHGNIRALITALQSKTNANLLSTPNLVTLDNEEAELSVGQNVPFVTGSLNDNGGNPFQTIERQDVGIVLKVTPQINEGNAVRLKIHQEVSSVESDPSVTNASDIITNKTLLDTTVLVDDGSILVLGGLIEDGLVGNERKVPLFGDIPFLGMLFRNEDKDITQNNLMVFLKPTILRDARNIARVTNSKYDYMRGLQAGLGDAGYVLPDAKQPVLPPINDFRKDSFETAQQKAKQAAQQAREQAAQEQQTSAWPNPFAF